MRKVNKLEICEKFNTLRQNNLHRKFTSEEMKTLMKGIGINNHIFCQMKDTFFRRRRVGKITEYCFTDTPIHKQYFIDLYAKFNSSRKEPKNLKEEEAIQLLKSLGYRIFKEEGIDENALLDQYPDIYEKFLITKEV